MSSKKKNIFSQITKNLSFNKKKEIKKDESHHSSILIDTHPQEHKLPSEHSDISKVSAYYSPDRESLQNEHNTNDKVTQNPPKTDLEFSFESFKFLQEVINSRRSVRSFTEQKPQYKIIYEIIKTAYNSPRAGNITNYHVIIVTQKDKIAQIANLAYQQSWIAQAPLLIVVINKKDEMAKFYPEKSDRFSTQNTAVFIQNLLLLIHSAGLSTCWVESFQEEIIKDYLGVSKLDEIHTILPVGYAKEIPKTPIFGDLMMYINYNSFGEKDPRD